MEVVIAILYLGRSWKCTWSTWSANRCSVNVIWNFTCQRTGLRLRRKARFWSRCLWNRILGQEKTMFCQNKVETWETQKCKAAPVFWNKPWKVWGQALYALGDFCMLKWSLGNCNVARSLFSSLAFLTDLTTAKGFQFQRRS